MTLEILTSDFLSPARHGFFTRRGGASSGIFEGLNCGLGSKDQQDVVMKNREMVANAMNVEPDHLVGVHQVHSPRVQITTEATIFDRPQADALVTKTPGIALSVLSADCPPVLFSDATAGVIGAAHAGWKGAVGGVITETVKSMVDLGAKPENITAAVGPCISQRSYEVGPEFFEQFCAKNTDYTRFFINGDEDRFLFDLPSFCLHQLRDAGITTAHWIGHCTYLDEMRFFSYRRSTHRKEPDYGRMISAIVL